MCTYVCMYVCVCMYMYVSMYVLGHKDGIIFFSTISWDISCCGKYLGCLGCLPTTMLRSTNLFLTYSHKIRQHWPSTRCVLSQKLKGANGTATFRILSQFINSILKIIRFLVSLLHPNVQLYYFECHRVTKIKYGHPWPNKVIKRSQNTVHKVTYGFNVQYVNMIMCFHC